MVAMNKAVDLSAGTGHLGNSGEYVYGDRLWVLTAPSRVRSKVMDCLGFDMIDDAQGIERVAFLMFGSEEMAVEYLKGFEATWLYKPHHLAGHPLTQLSLMILPTAYRFGLSPSTVGLPGTIERAFSNVENEYVFYNPRGMPAVGMHLTLLQIWGMFMGNQAARNLEMLATVVKQMYEEGCKDRAKGVLP